MAGAEIKEVVAKDDGVGLGELCVGAGVDGGQAAGVAARHPHRRAVVRRVVRALGHSQPHAWDVLVARQMCKVQLWNCTYFRESFLFIYVLM